jgi:general secretion pathway protein G
MVVMLILTIVVGLAVPRFLGMLGGAKTKAAVVQVENLSSAIEFFFLDTGRYPTTSEGLAALAAAPPNAEGWNGPYLRRKGDVLVPLDPWKNPYQYELHGSSQFTIRTLGADNKEGGEGEDSDYSSGS